MEVYKKQIKDIWLKAAVVGSLWGSIEIIVGSFFHNIKMPMSGTILAVLGISLLVAFGQIWKDKGLFWRAGLIAAVMKSVSPSAVLIGPMTGIFLEALLFEFAVTVFGRNVFAYVLGAISALYSVIIHKLATLLIIYGLDLIKITENFYFFLIKQLKAEELSFAEALAFLSLFYVILGIIAAVIGLITGKKALKMKSGHRLENKIEFDTEKDKVHPDENNRSLLMLLMHISFIIIILTVTNFFSLFVAFAVTFVYVVFVLIKYKRALRYFKKPGFWIQIVLFILISALFYDGLNRITYFSPEGIDAGLKMGLRAVLIVLGFSAISSELRNPLIRVLLYRKGFWQFYTALSSAFSVLPYLMKHSARPKIILKNPGKTLIKNILDAEYIFEQFKEMQYPVKIFVISGEKHSGKTTFAEKLILKLKENGYKTAGFTAPGKFNNNLRSEFNIRDIKTGKEKLLCSDKISENQKSAGRFYFNEEGLDFGKELLKPDNIKDADFVFIDELGPFELKGKGWSGSVENLLKCPEYKVVCLVRKKLVYDILRRFGITDAVIFDIADDTVDDFIYEIVKP